MYKNCLIIIFTFIFQSINSKTMYQCAKHIGMPDQCMSKWVDYYNNEMYDLWPCPMNKYCQVLERNYGEKNSIGVCMHNYKKLYDNDPCTKDSECASLNCQNNKCIGFKEGEYCTPNLFQCQDNLACKRTKELLPYGEEKEVFKCERVSKINETCENSDECDIKLVCAEKYSYDVINLMNKYKIDDITILINNITLEEYLDLKNQSQKICINRSSFENGIPTSDPMTCISGDSIELELFPNYNESICVSKINILKNCDKSESCMISINLGNYNKTNITQQCMLSSLGNPFCPFNQKEEAWKIYLKEYDNLYKSLTENNLITKIYHFPVYRDTFNDLKVSQSFWSYKLWDRYIEADYCARDFFFLKNSYNKIKYNYKYLGYLILYLLL